MLLPNKITYIPFFFIHFPYLNRFHSIPLLLFHSILFPSLMNSQTEPKEKNEKNSTCMSRQILHVHTYLVRLFAFQNLTIVENPSSNYKIFINKVLMIKRSNPKIKIFHQEGLFAKKINLNFPSNNYKIPQNFLTCF